MSSDGEFVAACQGAAEDEPPARGSGSDGNDQDRPPDPVEQHGERIAALMPVESQSFHALEPFSLAFADPPYGRGLAEKALAGARAGGWLAPDALVVVEEAVASSFAAPHGFDELERRSYDDTALVFMRCRA